jgi:hypothetical protein
MEVAAAFSQHAGTFPPEFVSIFVLANGNPDIRDTAKKLGCPRQRVSRMIYAMKTGERCPGLKRGPRPYQEEDPREAFFDLEFAHEIMRRQFVYDFVYGYFAGLLSNCAILHFDSLLLCLTNEGFWEPIGMSMEHYQSGPGTQVTLFAFIMNQKCIRREFFVDKHLTGATMLTLLEKCKLENVIKKPWVVTVCDRATTQVTKPVRAWFASHNWHMLPQWPADSSTWLPVQTYFDRVLRELRKLRMKGIVMNREELKEVLEHLWEEFEPEEELSIVDRMHRMAAQYWGTDPETTPPSPITPEMDADISRKVDEEGEAARLGNVAEELRLHWIIVNQRRQMLEELDGFQEKYRLMTGG